MQGYGGISIMVGMGTLMRQICTSISSSLSTYPIEKVKYSPYSYSINAKISYQNKHILEQYSWSASLFVRPRKHIIIIVTIIKERKGY